MNDTNPSSRVALVAGGTGALGSGVCRAFAEAGASVCGTYHSAEGLGQLKEAGL